MFDFFDSWMDMFYRALGMVIHLSVWSLVACVYAGIGIAIGACIRNRHEHDSLSYPIIGMVIALTVFLPLTVYWLG